MDSPTPTFTISAHTPGRTRYRVASLYRNQELSRTLERAHAGLTGRKTAVDGYGDFARSGAAAMSGEDPSRIDRVGSYAARHAARNVVAAGLAERCEVQLSYAIGHAQPVSILVDTFGTGRVSDSEVLARIRTAFDFRPAAIVRRFGLRSLPARRDGIFYRELAAYGQVGRNELDLPWEKLDHVAALGGGGGHVC